MLSFFFFTVPLVFLYRVFGVCVLFQTCSDFSRVTSISLEKCYEVTTHFQESGLPASIFIFKEMDQANGINNSHLPGNSAVFEGDGAQRWQTEGGASSVDVAGTNTFALGLFLYLNYWLKSLQEQAPNSKCGVFAFLFG